MSGVKSEWLSLASLALAALAIAVGVGNEGRVLLTTVVVSLVSAGASLVESTGEVALDVLGASRLRELVNILGLLCVVLVKVGKDTALGVVASLQALVGGVNENVGGVVLVVDGGSTNGLALVDTRLGNLLVVLEDLLVAVLAVAGVRLGGRRVRLGLVTLLAEGGPLVPDPLALVLVTAGPGGDTGSPAAPAEGGEGGVVPRSDAVPVLLFLLEEVPGNAEGAGEPFVKPLFRLLPRSTDRVEGVSARTSLAKSS